jgi:hypothetical protein
MNERTRSRTKEKQEGRKEGRKEGRVWLVKRKKGGGRKGRGQEKEGQKEGQKEEWEGRWTKGGQDREMHGLQEHRIGGLSFRTGGSEDSNASHCHLQKHIKLLVIHSGQ